MTPSKTVLETYGFVPPQLAFTLRTAIAVLLAIGLSASLGLEHPQWSGMSVWAASLPVRGHLLEKSLYRALGTILGALYGIGLLMAGADHLWLVIALAVWIGLAAALGNVARGFTAYGVMLSGYSAAMVTLLHSARSGDPFAVGFDRMLTVLIGVAVALAVGLLFARDGESDDPAERVRKLTADGLSALAARLAAPDVRDLTTSDRLLSDMAAIEDQLDGSAAGSPRLHQLVRALRRLLSDEVALLLWLRRRDRPEEDPMLGAAVAAMAAPTPDDLVTLAGLARDPVLRQCLADMSASARAIVDTASGAAPRVARLPPVILHRDWVGAREAFIRAAAVILAVGGLWLLSGVDAGALMLLGTAVMATVFSAADAPTTLLRKVIVGQSLGVIGALACRWLVWPVAGNEAMLIVGLSPFVLLGGLLFGHKRGAGPIGFDYNMVLLLLLQPQWPLAGSFDHSLVGGAAVICGPVISLAAFALIFPMSGQRRLTTLAGMMVRDVERLAARRGAARRRRLWRARLFHRVLRLVRWADKTGANRREAIDASFALLLSGAAALHLDEVLDRPDLSPMMQRRIEVARRRLAQLGNMPDRAAQTLAAVARRLGHIADVETALLKRAATGLREAAPFLKQISRTR
jgi:uncharacterized membrane protein YccC